MDPLAAVRTGFAAIDADPAIKERALQFLKTWLTHPDFSVYRPQIDHLIQTGKWSVLLDSFYQVLPFGTAVGAGRSASGRTG
jgi:phosphoglucomutase/phosphomannomutase